MPGFLDRVHRQILGLCACLAGLVPVALVAGVVASGSGTDLASPLRATLLLSLVSLGWAVPVGLLLAPVLYGEKAPILRVVLGTLWDLPTVSVAVLLANVVGHGPLAGMAVGLVVVPHVALGAARALERSSPSAFRAARALGMPRRRFAFRIGLPRVQGPVSAALLRGWGRGVGEALITQAALGDIALTGVVMTSPEAARGPAMVLVLVAVLTPVLAGLLERT